MAGYARTLSQELFQSHKINSGKIRLVKAKYDLDDGKVTLY